MKLLISFLISIFLLSSNLYASENSTAVPKIENKQIQKLLESKNSITQKTRSFKNDLLEVFKHIRPFIVPAIIVIWLITWSSNKSKDKPVQNKKTKSASSRTEEYVENKNEDHKDDNNKETENDKSYEDEWNYDQEEIPNLRIKIEEQQVEDSKVYDVEAFGILGFTQEQIDQTKIENEEAKFTCYVFDVTDENNEIALQGLTDPFRDDKFLLQSSRNMKVGLGYAYNAWTPMFRFPVSIVIPPNRGKRKLKFVVSATKLNAEFDNGKIKNKKDLYLEVETFFYLNFEEPGYLDAEQYEGDINEKIVQLGMAVAYSEKKINTQGIEAIKRWINSEIIWKNYFEETIDQKIKYSFLLKNTHELLKANKLSLSEIVKEINYKSSVSKRYDAMNLLLNVAGSDDRLSKEEDKLLNNTARALELDLNRFQQMKTSTIANIETIEESDEDSEETIFNFSKDMTDAEKCKKLREEYTRWNRQTNNSNEKIRNQARKMVELTANLRKKYNC